MLVMKLWLWVGDYVCFLNRLCFYVIVGLGMEKLVKRRNCDSVFLG